jgi:hypothetical protein
VLAGWLHRATRLAFLQASRTERRRIEREQESFSMNTPGSDANPDWEQLRPLLDEALDQMNPLDRDALLLRFFEQRSLKEVGAALGSGEDAARKRVARALDKLRELLVCRGVTTPVSALAAAMTAKGIETAPASLAGTIAATSIAAGGATGITAIHIMKAITMSQIKTAILAAAAVAGITIAVAQHQSVESLRAENLALRERSQKLAELQAENERLSKLAAQIQQPVQSKEQNAELLRLRGQVGLLRDQLKKALAASQTAPVNQNATPSKLDAAGRDQPFTAALTTRLENNQTLVTGGWSTAPGMRTFVVMTPKIQQGEGSTTQTASDGSQFEMPNAKVAFNTSTVELPETMLSQFGLDQFRADGQDSSVQGVLAGADAKSLLDALSTAPEGVTVTHGQITTADGIAATMSVLGDSVGDSSGQPPAPRYSIGLTPSLTDNQTAMNLAVNLQISKGGVRQ